MENAFEDALLKWANLPSDDVGLGGVFARELLATRAQLAALQIETLKAQLAEAEADAERFDRRRIQCNDMEEFRCVFCGKLQNEDYSWEKDETDELHCKDCIHILHRERLSRK